ncbi:thiazole synthase [Shigella flexneri]
MFTGTGKFASPQLMVDAIRESGSRAGDLAMKRVDLRQHDDADLAPLLEAGVTLSPILAGAKTAEEAIFAAQLATPSAPLAEAGSAPDARWLLPDPNRNPESGREAGQQGFRPALCGANPVLCKRRKRSAGCRDAILARPLAPIRSGNPCNAGDRLPAATVPWWWCGSAAQPRRAQALGDRRRREVLVNTAIAVADDPVNDRACVPPCRGIGLLRTAVRPGSRSVQAQATSR